jgi:manganese/zinc/iron transport system substrate-binding protein
MFENRRNRALIVMVIALLGAALVLTGCAAEPGADGEPVGDRRVAVTATTNIVADLATVIGGDRVEVTALMRPGIDPHGYKASAGDVRRMGEADLLVWNGLELEGKMGDVFEELGASIPAVAVAEAVPESRRIASPDFASRFDPHVWNDPGNWALAGARLAEALAEIDPAHAEEYRARARDYADELNSLEVELRDSLRRIPDRKRVIVTSHDAFAYLGRTFDLEVAGIQGVSTASEATTADIDRVARLVADRGLEAVFVESSVPRQTVDAVLAAAASRGQRARVGGELYSDSAGDAGTPEGTYVGMMRANVRTIVAGLAPPAR